MDGTPPHQPGSLAELALDPLDPYAIERNAKTDLALLKGQREAARGSEAAGLLIAKETVEKHMADLAATVMNGLKALPARLASHLVGLTSEHEIRLLLIDEVNEIITAIRQECNAAEESGDEPMMHER